MPEIFHRELELKHYAYNTRTIINDEHVEVSLTEWPNGEGWTLDVYGGTSKDEAKIEMCSESIELLKKCLTHIPNDDDDDKK